MSVDSYVVRVYRRGEASEDNLVGMVEIVDTQEKKTFKNFDELRGILVSSDTGISGRACRNSNQNRRNTK